MSPTPEMAAPGYVTGRRVLTSYFQWQFWDPAPEEASDEVVAAYLADIVAGAREALAEAQVEWTKRPALREQDMHHFADNLLTVFGLARGPTGRNTTRNRLLVVDILLKATQSGPPEDPALQALRAHALNEINLELLTQDYCPIVAQRTGFGERHITFTRSSGPGPWAWWWHPDQVDVGLKASDMARQDLADVIRYACTEAAMTRVLDVWHAEGARRRPDAPQSPLTDQTLDVIVKLRTQNLAVEEISGAVEALRLLRDHPRTAPTFWADVLATANPNELTLLAFESLAAETAGPGAASALEQLADARVAHWVVPEAIAARAALRLHARRAPAHEMPMP